MSANVFLPSELDFLRPYVKRAVPDVQWYEDALPADVNILVLSENRHHAERPDLRAMCSKAGCVILNCPDIIGTGMTGFPGALAKDVARGYYMHFPGNEARRSTIHATDVAAAVALVAEKASPNDEPKEYILSDGSDPLITDIAEAFAFRMQNKRISNISTRPQQLLAKILYGRRKYNMYTESNTVAADFKFDYPAFAPVDVCTYMRTHIYNEDSL